MIVLAIDPGNAQSAFVVYDGAKLWQFGKVDNEQLLTRMHQPRSPSVFADHLVIEHIANMGMSVGQSVFDTCLWSGRFIEAWQGPFSLVKRVDVKRHICGTHRAKDSNIRTALIDRFSNGQGKGVAIGTKAAPGSLYGVSADVWSALAIAVTWTETRSQHKEAA